MEMRTLRYFVTVAEELNITRAAERLNMSQPPLSHQMQLLEQELGCVLFTRGKRHLQLTDEGILLLRRARQILDMEEKTRDEIAEIKSGISGKLFISMVEGRAPYFAAQWIAGFHEEYPNVRYSLWNGSTDDALDRLNKGLADLAIVAAPYNTEVLNGLILGSEPWVAILPANHPLASEPGNELPLKKLAGQKLIVPSRPSRRQAIRRWFSEQDIDPFYLCETSNYVDAVALSEKGVGISIFPRTTTTPGSTVVVKNLIEPAHTAEYVLAWPKNRMLSPSADEFVNYVSDCLQISAVDN